MKEKDLKGLKGKAAIDRLKELINAASICMFSTSMFQWPLQKKELKGQMVDDQGNIYFEIERNSESSDTELLVSDPQVQLFYSNSEKSEFLSVFGNVTVSADVPSNFMGNMLDEKVENAPQINLLKIEPEEAYYWDQALNDMVPMNLMNFSDDNNIDQKLCA